MSHDVLKTISIKNEVGPNIDFLLTDKDIVKSEDKISNINDRVHLNADGTKEAVKDRIPKYKCGSCLKSYKVFGMLKKHLAVCYLNSSYHSRKAEMIKNIQKIEEDAVKLEKENICFCCGESYDTFHRGHIYCSDCPNSFKTQISYERHVFITHSEVDKFPCSKCEAKLRTATLLKLHKKQHTTSERLHKRAHTRKEPFICDFCEKKCFSPGELKIHRRCHTGEKPYACTECNQTFSTKSSLNRHLRRHTGEKPYTCTECEKSFAIKHALNRHMERHIGDKSQYEHILKTNKKHKKQIQIHSSKSKSKNENQEDKLKCKDCKAIYTTEEELKIHYETGTHIPEYNKSSPKDVKERKKNCTLCSIEFNSVKDSIFHFLKIHREHPQTFLSAKCAQNLEPNNVATSSEKHYRSDNSNENPIENVTPTDNNVLPSLKYEELSSMVNGVIKQECIVDERTEPTTEKLLFNNENKSERIQPTHMSNNEQIYINDEVIMQQFIKQEDPDAPAENLLLESEMYSIITIENETIKNEPESAVTETPDGTIINDRIPLDYGGVSQKVIENSETETVTEQLIMENESTVFNVHKSKITNEPYINCDSFKKKLLKLGVQNDLNRSYNSENPYSCAKCNKSFSLKRSLNYHIRYHCGKKLNTCTECNKIFASKKGLNIHMRQHTGERPYKCTECNKGFTHTGKKLYICTECDKSFPTKRSLNLHMRQHTSEKPFSCTECNQSFYIKSLLNLHMRQHTCEKLFSCIECNKSFSAKEGLTIHMMRHTGQDPFSCTECNKTFAAKQRLKIHMRRHTGEKPFTCSECNISFSFTSSLYRHMKRHTGQKPYSCTECNKSFAVKHDLNLHIKRHTGEKPFSCTECNKTYAVKDELKIHMRRHTGEKPFTCIECNKSFAAKQTLYIHMKRHSNQKPYSCTECDKNYAAKQGLKIHMRQHTGEKPFSCTECNKSFTAKQGLKVHMQRHTGEKPFSCTECNKSFASKQRLKIHMQRHADQKPHVCNECGKCYLQEIELRYHRKTHLHPFACDQCEEKFKTNKKLEQHIKTHSSENKQKNEPQGHKFKCKDCEAIYSTEDELKIHHNTGIHLDLEKRRRDEASFDKKFKPCSDKNQMKNITRPKRKIKLPVKYREENSSIVQEFIKDEVCEISTEQILLENEEYNSMTLENQSIKTEPDTTVPDTPASSFKSGVAELEYIKSETNEANT
ncbi:zinc finger protein 184-like [Teleopsis dalmanni]|uniref:zinc finger protein 184-like n=1 Tax=Teleopsis dalmanni TaxID=139649 RepID=UPI0018CEA5A7|nr:zinc finger protein 184-like [Teleopsis dalmanni]